MSALHKPSRPVIVPPPVTKASTKAAMPKKSKIDSVFGSAVAAHKSAARIGRMVAKWRNVDITGAADEAISACKTLIETIAAQKAEGFTPPVGVGAGKLVVSLGTQVWLRAKHHADYLEAYSEVELNSLYVEKLIGKRALVRIGAEMTGGNVRKMLGFVPLAHLSANPR
jgi:acetaldehyde dehydrogenase (acetylating)